MLIKAVLAKSAFLFVLAASLAIPSRAAAQTTELQETPPSNLLAGASLPSPVVDRPVSWRLLVPNLISDQKRIWTFPARLTEGHDWIATTAVLGTTAGLIMLDPTEGAYFRRTSSLNGFNNIFSGSSTAVGIIVVPASLYAVGLIRKDSKMQRTALLAGEAVANGEILATVLKDVTERMRPAVIPTGGNYSDSWFKSNGSLFAGNGSFPSGHTIAAFSVATIVARRYGNHRWIPYAAYGAAAIVGFSRLSLSAHFLSDVFMGGALGYFVSRFTVLRE